MNYKLRPAFLRLILN